MHWSPANHTPSIFKKVSPLGYRYEDHQDDVRFAGTGFFYYHQWGVEFDAEDKKTLPPTGPYLITNKHIVDPEGLRPPKELTYYIRPESNHSVTQRESILLYDESGEPVWAEHPDDIVDVVAIPIEDEPDMRMAFHRGDIPGDEGVVTGGDLAIVIGYPDLLPQFNRMPVMRDALVSSPYEVAYSESPYFYVDAKLHMGMSGSPVIANTPSSSSFLGVFSDDIIGFDDSPNENQSDQEKETSNFDKTDQDTRFNTLEQRLSILERETGLNTVWHSNLLDDIIKNINQ